MKKFISRYLILISPVLVSLTSYAGPSSSGGGFAVVCRDNNKTILSAELVDLYEGRLQFGFQLYKPTGDSTQEYIRAVKNGYRHQGYLPPISDEEISTNIQRFLSIVNWLPQDEKLPNLNDLGSEISVPEGCAVEPVAIFYDLQNAVSIDQEIWNALDSQNQAALIIHETNYRYMRSMAIHPDTDSSEARIVTVSDFATNLTPAKSGIPSNVKSNTLFHSCKKTNPHSTSCSQPTEYYLFPIGEINGIKQFRIQFTHLAGRAIKALTIIDLPQIISYGTVYPIQSQQLVNWTAEVAADSSRLGVNGNKLIIRKGNKIIIEFPM